MEPPSESSSQSGRPRWSRLTDRVTGAERERRLIVRIAQLEERLARIEEGAAQQRAYLGRLGAHIATAERDVEHLRWVAAPGVDPVNVPRNGRLVLSGDHPSSMVICSAASGADADLLSVTGTTHAAYAWRWGWDIVLDGRTDDQRDATEAKLRLIRELCDRHAWVLWLDPGTSITCTDADILAATQHDTDLYVSKHPSHAPISERALILARATDWTRQLLDQLIERPDASLAPERYAIVGDAWDWQPGAAVEEGPYAMLAPQAEATVRHAVAVERLAMLRRGAAGIVGPFGVASPLAAFPPTTSAAIPDLLGALGLDGTAVVAGPAAPAFDAEWRGAWHGHQVIRVGGPDEPGGEVPGVIRWSCSEDDALGRLEDPVDIVWLLGGRSDLHTTRRLMNWWPLVRPGGVMMGFPFNEVAEAGGDRTSAEPVRWFFEQLGIPLWVTHDADGTATWMAHRPADNGQPDRLPPPSPEDNDD